MRPRYGSHSLTARREWASVGSVRDRASATPPTSSAWAGDVDTFIVSDLHLGLPAARPRDLLEVLEEWRFKRLILLGDVLHDWSFRHLCADTWRLLAHIRRLSQPARGRGGLGAGQP